MHSYATRALLVLFLSCAGSLCPRIASAQSAEDLVREPDDARRIEAWLRYDAERVGPRVLGIVETFSGAAMLAVGAVELYTGGSEGRATRDVIGAIGLGAGASFLATGIHEWLVDQSAPDRFERWQRITARGANPDIVTAFEGELRSLSEQSHLARIYRIILGSTLGVVGGTITIIAALGGAPEGQRDGHYLRGGLTCAGGLLVAGLALFRSMREIAWESYRNGLAPKEENAHARMGLFGGFLAGNGFELGLSGTF